MDDADAALGFQALHDHTADGYRALVGLHTPDLAATRTHPHTHGVRTWAERDDPDSSSLHLADLHGDPLVAVHLREPTG
ncbi:hypothetical protein [Kitasatospora sp. SUK 42]|uniref:hypothetical protein n=1 Tax=Kitasatospora sp. SUK 42 TaxID=1588882 RepID=UPI0018CB9C2B|nr:hypothetical protein [Kitasatospora sp. SUK 42]MBV2153380.1 hypothetical protein [Kitasatospora sp. SUK 42]